MEHISGPRSFLIQFAAFSAFLVLCGAPLLGAIDKLSVQEKEIVNFASPALFAALSAVAFFVLSRTENAIRAALVASLLAASTAILVSAFGSGGATIFAVIGIGSSGLAYSAGLYATESIMRSGSYKHQPATAAIAGAAIGAGVILWAALYSAAGALATTASAAAISLIAILALGRASVSEAPVKSAVIKSRGRDGTILNLYMAALFTAFGVAYSHNFSASPEGNTYSILYGPAIALFALAYMVAAKKKALRGVVYALPVMVTIQLTLQIGASISIANAIFEPSIIAGMPFLIIHSYQTLGRSKPVAPPHAILAFVFIGFGAMIARTLPQIGAAMVAMVCLVAAVLLPTFLPRRELCKEDQLKEYMEIAKEIKEGR
ncbi:MAG: hypothetical protein PHH26_02550 [Candidatus Thermoplasmatota archaeon]|nr:hypothetical protein [Candidatus Thermoplasmatota archaeon]